MGAEGKAMRAELAEVRALWVLCALCALLLRVVGCRGRVPPLLVRDPPRLLEVRPTTTPCTHTLAPPPTRSKKKQMTDRTSMPNIFIAKVGVGGCNDGPGVATLAREGKLDGLLRAAGAL